ncbi:DUF4440 domain-containing protein [Tessaracoccus flavus]|nr:nuclear transport factor 2 family protein [Tessaracoccus flavus]
MNTAPAETVRRNRVAITVYGAIRAAITGSPPQTIVFGADLRQAENMNHAHLQALEESLLTTAVRADRERLLALLHEEFVEVGRSGRRWTRAEIVESLADEAERETPPTDEWSFNTLSPTLTLLTYRISGQEFDSRHSSVWDTAGDVPRMRFHQGTPITNDTSLLAEGMSNIIVERPKVVCLCGSLRFQRLFDSERKRLTARGIIVLAPEPVDEEPTASMRATLGELHLRRIDLADEVRVVSEGGYIGDATRREILYARATNKVVSAVEANVVLPTFSA